ncbi:MAG TPA: right-handed parallel beta-helix repeat-containing protein [Ktedonosporobacter sp.]|nr:right-handed parallel beta-helix repeat-containing protein [Ktedonosporobacter sp.]
MRKVFYALALLLPITALIGALIFGFNFLYGASAASVKANTPSVITCTPTGFIRDGINLTAAVIPTAGSPNVKGTVNANGCNIGVYYSPNIKGTVQAEVFGANYFGVVNNGSTVTVSHSFIHNIGEKPFNGTQHGVSIYFAPEIGARGSITNNHISLYQKGGIVVTGSSSSATISNNTVNGLGPVNFIAQNGIEIGRGAKGTITKNTVTGNSYTGPNFASSGGILVFGGSCYGTPLTVGTQIQNNTLQGNDVGVFLSNLIQVGSNCVLPTTPTKIVASNNNIRNDAVTNTTGGNLLGAPGAYQAGISDEGYADQLIYNKICGIGYTPVPNPPPYLSRIDVVATNPVVHSNSTCSKKDPNIAVPFNAQINGPARNQSVAHPLN